MIQESIKLLGQHAVDKITGVYGVVTSVSFDVAGCIQCVLTPPATADNELKAEGRWYDVARLELRGKQAMPCPDFDASGSDPSAYGKGAMLKTLPR